MRRSGVYSGIGHGENAYFSYRSRLYRFHQASNQLSLEMRFKRGNGPLQFCAVEKITGFDDCLLFGEYFGNANKDPIRIYQKKEHRDWQPIYSFAAGELNHIHNIVPDPYRDCLWVLGGDFGEAASIWQVRNNFRTVRRIVSGSQKYRACVAFPTKQGLLYATDSQLAKNSIRLLEEKAGRWQSVEVAPLNGPSIYGCATKDYYVFSTSTEPTKDYKNKYAAMLDNRPASVIEENRSFIITCAKSDFRCSVLSSKQKDRWPYRMFQFGSITFPGGINPSNMLYTHSIGSSQDDLAMEVWQL
ncbi:MAG: hypothetical protein AAGD11_12610 [Planctomycetota bacterium]